LKEESNKKKERKYAKDFYEKNKGTILSKQKTRRDQLGKELLNRQRTWYVKEKEVLKREFPSKCPLCGSLIPKRSVFHEVNGKPHIGRLAYIKRNKKDFVLLCSSIPCHAVAHWFLKLGYNWKETLEIVQKLRIRKI
jgi:hypothetical protein